MVEYEKLVEEFADETRSQTQSSQQKQLQEKKLNGFAALSIERRAEISRLGGLASQKAGGHRFTSEEAKLAGRKGGEAHRQKMLERGKTLSSNRSRTEEEVS